MLNAASAIFDAPRGAANESVMNFLKCHPNTYNDGLRIRTRVLCFFACLLLSLVIVACFVFVAILELVTQVVGNHDERQTTMLALGALSCATLAASVSLHGSGRRFEVQLVASPAPCDGEAYETADASGRHLSCCIPSMASAQRAAAPMLEHWQVLSREHLGGKAPCLRRRSGYWTYEVCPGRSAQQYSAGTREEPDNAMAASPSATHGISLGTYDAGLDELLADAAGSIVLRQHFPGGDGGRTALVDYVCDGGGSGASSLAAAAALPADIVSIAEDVAAKTYVIVVATPDAALCSALFSVERAAVLLNHSCASHAEGWWHFEVCVGGAVKQWHDAGGGKRVQESVLGVYDWRAGSRIDVETVGEPAALVQRYSDGTPCDLLGGVPRTVTVRFECASPRAAAAAPYPDIAIRAVAEPSTCAYVVALSTPAVCAHPDLKPELGAAAYSDESVIACIAVGGDDATTEAGGSLSAGARR